MINPNQRPPNGLYLLLQRLASLFQFLQRGPALGQGRRHQDRSYKPHASSLGRGPIVLCLAAYWIPMFFSGLQIFHLPLGLLLFLLPLAIYIREQQSGLVQFHGLQAGLFFLLLSLLRLGLLRLLGLPLLSHRLLFLNWTVGGGVYLLYQLLSLALTFFSFFVCLKLSFYICRWEEYSLPLLGPCCHWLLRRL